MSWLQQRGADWVPGAITLAAAALAAWLLAYSLSIRVWSIGLGLFLVSILVIGQVERLLAARKAPREARSKSKLKLIRGGKGPRDYDLENDDTTNNQRWLM